MSVMDEESSNPPAISVRRMREEETGDARSLAGRTFPRPENAFFSPPQTLVAERDGRLAGAVVPKVFDLPRRRRCGAIFWLMTDPQARGLGVGGRLVEATLGYFEELRLPPVVASIPEPEPPTAPVANPVYVASFMTGMPVWPAVMHAGEASLHMANVEFRQAVDTRE